MDKGYLDQLLQLFKGCVWDGDLLSKTHRDELYKRELIDRARGMNFITSRGVEVLWEIGIIRQS